MLEYMYRPGSTLPRRTFVLNVQVNGSDQQVQVVAPDQYMAAELLRRSLESAPSVHSFWTYAVREVTRNYRGELLVRPFMLDGRTVRFPYSDQPVSYL